MTTLTQGIQRKEWLISTGDGQISYGKATVTVAGGVALPSGQLLGKLSATGKYVAYNDAGSGGAEAVAAILVTACPGVNGDYQCAIVERLAEVWGAMLTGLNANGTADLKALNIIVR